MVHIRGLQIKGFKSFNNQTQLKFGPGLNCVVGPNGSGKCLRRDARVQLADGRMVPIGELVDQEIKKKGKPADDGYISGGNGLKIMSLDLSSFKIEPKEIQAFVKRKAPEKLVRILTRSGREIVSTEYHPLFVFENETIKSINAEDLTVGTKIAIPKNLKIKSGRARFYELLDLITTPDNIYVPYSEELRKILIRMKENKRWEELSEDIGIPLSAIKGLLDKQAINFAHLVKVLRCFKLSDEEVIALIPEVKSKNGCKKYKMLWDNSPQFARLLGYLLAEGRLPDSSDQVWFVNGTPEIVEDYVSLVREVFGVDPTVNEYKPRCWDVLFYSVPIRVLLHKFGMSFTGTKDKRIANIFLKNSSEEELAELLNGLYCGDGYVSKSSVEIVSKSKDLAEAIGSILLRLGIVYRLKKKIKIATNSGFCGLYYQINVFGVDNFEKFYDRIRLTHIGKRLKLEKLITVNSNPNLDLWEANRLVKQVANELNISVKLNKKEFPRLDAYVYNQCLPSSYGIRHLVNGLFVPHSNGVCSLTLQKLMQIGNSDIFWDEIVDVESISHREEWVYDLCVEGSHNFIANNVVVHNSNIIDALCFALGQSSSKSLRADNYSELLYRSKDENHASAGIVKFELDNNNGVFPIDSKTIEVSRVIKSNGSTQFKINGRNATRQQVMDLLGHAKIDPDGHQIILQGDINRFVEMKPTERRNIVEEIAGINQYEQKKERAVSELQKIDEKLKEAKIILTEKDTYLKGLYDEKIEAEKYRDLNNELKATQVTEVHLRKVKAEASLSDTQKTLAKLEKELEELTEATNSKKDKAKELEKNIKELESEIEKKGGEEQLHLQKNIEQLRIDLENSKNLIQSSRNEIQRIESRKTQLEKNLESIEKKIGESKSDKSATEKERNSIKKEIESLQKRAKLDSESLDDTQKTLDKLENDIDSFRSDKEKNTEKVQQIDGQKELMSYKIQELENKIEELASQQSKISQAANARERYKNIIAEINKLENEDSRLSLELGNLRKLKAQQEDNIAQVKANVGATDYILKRDRAIKHILGLKSQLKGIIGTVAELAKVDSKFNTALNVAAGSRMKNIVVHDPETAIKCLAELKKSKSGVATFLPLSKLQPFLKPVSSLPGVFGVASDLVKCKKEHEKVFQYIFGDTVVIENTTVAQRLGINQYKMVTLDGDLFQKGGAITGGYRQKGTGLSFQETENEETLNAEMKKLKDMRKALEDFEKRREDLDKIINNLRREKAELEGSIEAAKGLDLQDISILEKEKKKLQTEIQVSEKLKASLLKSITNMDEQIDKLRVQRNLLNNRVRDLQFGKQAEQMKKLERQEQGLNAKLASLDAQLENALLPEQNNISRVIKELEKERKEFETQINSKEKESASFEKNLKNLEEEEKDFYGKLKSLFKKKADSKDELDALNKELEEFGQKMSSMATEKNDLAIEKAKVESKISGLIGEAEQFKGIKLLENVKSAKSAADKIQELTEKLVGLGTVNMKALEVYEGLKEEYDKLAWRVSKLNSEKDDVETIINEVEKKKKDAFMESYEKLTENFSKLFEKMTDKGTATLVLDNPASPFEGGIDVRIKHKEGKFVTLASLSGGEKVIVALALIFSIQEFSPAPFYLMDEIDAALDSVNSEKVASLLREYASKAQVIMISHNDAIVSAANNLYGVSMSEKGESSVVSLEL